METTLVEKELLSGDGSIFRGMGSSRPAKEREVFGVVPSWASP